MASRTAAGVVGKPRSSAALGTYYRSRSKAFLEAHGYQVAILERMMWIRRPGKPCAICARPDMFPTKSDQFASDLLAVKDDAVEFVQVKFGRTNIAAGVREFRKFVFPPFVRQVLHVWEERARAPEIIDCATYALPPDRRRQSRETLF